MMSFNTDFGVIMEKLPKNKKPLAFPLNIVYNISSAYKL